MRTPYLTSEARKSAICKISELREKVSRVSGEHLSYTDASDIIRYLSDYMRQIEKDEIEASKK